MDNNSLMPHLPILTVKNEHQVLDLGAISTGILEGGADIIGNRFNLAVHLTPKEAKQELLKALSQKDIYMHQLESLSDKEKFGIYFELYNAGTINRSSPLLSHHQQHSDSVIPVPDTLEMKLSKVPDRYDFASGSPWEVSIAVWKAKELVRKTFSQEPVVKGLIVIEEYLYKDQHNMKGNAVVKYAIASRPKFVDIFSEISMLHTYAEQLKMFDTSFLVEKEKKFNEKIKSTDLATLNEHTTGIGYSFKLKSIHPLMLYTQLAKQFGYTPVGFAWVDDPVFVGAKTNGSQEFDLNNMPKDIPGMGGIQLIGPKGNQIQLVKDEYAKDTYTFSISDTKCETARAFMVEFTRAIALKGAVTTVKTDYKKLFSDNTSVYLPGFPLATESVISLSYSGDLSPLHKNKFI